MTDLRKLARGRECQVRQPGICNRNPETTVLAHFRMIGVSGAGLKSGDLLASHCCHACHMWVDGQAGKGLREARELALLRGVMRTQAWLIKNDVVSW